MGGHLTSSFVQFFLAIPAKMHEDDKRKHISWSFCLTLFALIIMPTLEALILVFLAGLAKECWDHFYGSGFCFFDMAGNFIGSFLALLLSFITSRIFFHA